MRSTAMPANATPRRPTRPLPRGSCQVPPSVRSAVKEPVDVGDEQIERRQLRFDGNVERRAVERARQHDVVVSGVEPQPVEPHGIAPRQSGGAAQRDAVAA